MQKEREVVLWQWVCGFANAQGGTIYIGIDDAGNVAGVKDVKKLKKC